MRTFKNFPKEAICPICNTSKQGECVLIGIEGTKDGNNIEAKPFHLDCIELTYNTEYRIIAQIIEVK